MKTLLQLIKIITKGAYRALFAGFFVSLAINSSAQQANNIKTISWEGMGDDYLIDMKINGNLVYVAGRTNRTLNLASNIAITPSANQFTSFVACYDISNSPVCKWAKQFNNAEINQLIFSQDRVIFNLAFSDAVSINYSLKDPSPQNKIINLTSAGATDVAMIRLDPQSGEVYSIMHYADSTDARNLVLAGHQNVRNFTWSIQLNDVSTFTVQEYERTSLDIDLKKKEFPIKSTNHKGQSQVINFFPSSSEFWGVFISDSEAKITNLGVTTSDTKLFLGGQFGEKSDFTLETFFPKLPIMLPKPVPVVNDIKPSDGTTFLAVYDSHGNKYFLANARNKSFTLKNMFYDPTTDLLHLYGNFKGVTTESFFNKEIIPFKTPGQKGLRVDIMAGSLTRSQNELSVVSKPEANSSMGTSTQVVTAPNTLDTVITVARYDVPNDLPIKGVQTTSQGTTISTGTFDRDVVLPINITLKPKGGQNGFMITPNDNFFSFTGNLGSSFPLYDESESYEIIGVQMNAQITTSEFTSGKPGSTPSTRNLTFPNNSGINSKILLLTKP